MKSIRLGTMFLAIGAVLCSLSVAQDQVQVSPPTASLSGRAAIAKIYGSDDFKVARVGPIQWEPNGDAYTLLQPEPQDPDVFDVVECTIASGSRRVLVNGSKLFASRLGRAFPD